MLPPPIVHPAPTHAPTLHVRHHLNPSVISPLPLGAKEVVVCWPPGLLALCSKSDTRRSEDWSAETKCERSCLTAGCSRGWRQGGHGWASAWVHEWARPLHPHAGYSLLSQNIHPSWQAEQVTMQAGTAFDPCMHSFSPSDLPAFLTTKASSPLFGIVPPAACMLLLTSKTTSRS